MRALSWIRSVATIALLTSNISARAAKEGLLMEEALNNWRVLEKAGSRLESLYTHTIKHENKVTATQVKVLTDGEERVRIYSKELKKPDSTKPLLEKVVGKNSRYVFELRRKVGSPEYMIDYVGPSQKAIDNYLLSPALVKTLLRGHGYPCFLEEAF